MYDKGNDALNKKDANANVTVANRGGSPLVVVDSEEEREKERDTKEREKERKKQIRKEHKMELQQRVMGQRKNTTTIAIPINPITAMGKPRNPEPDLYMY
jgi:hypothetical protein